MKEGATSNLMGIPKVKSEVPEGIYVMDVEGASSGEPLAKGPDPATASTSSLILPLSHYALVTQAVLATLGILPDFEPLRVAYTREVRRFPSGRDVVDTRFQTGEDDTPHTIYTRLARFSRDFGSVFAESQLVRVFLSNIDIRLLDLALLMIIMEFGGRATLAKKFTIVEQCDCALCQHDVTHLVLPNPGRFQLRLLDWLMQKWTRPYIVGLVGMRAALRRIVLQSQDKPTMWVIRSGYMFPLRISRKGRVFIYPSS